MRTWPPSVAAWTSRGAWRLHCCWTTAPAWATPRPYPGTWRACIPTSSSIPCTFCSARRLVVICNCFYPDKQLCYGLVIKYLTSLLNLIHNRYESYNILTLCFQVDNCSDTKGGKPLNRYYSISVSCLIVIIIWDQRNTLLQYQHRLLRDFDYSICIYSKSVGETSTTNTTLDWVMHI